MTLLELAPPAPLELDQHLDTLLPQLHSEPEPDEDLLQYRDEHTRGEWWPISSIREAEGLVRARSPRNPWITITRETNPSAPTGSLRWGFECLGWDDRVVVNGDHHTDTHDWLWTSWPTTTQALDQPLVRTTVGPFWFQATVWTAQLETLHDAILQVAPALHAIPHLEEQTPGFLWRERSHDASKNLHLRHDIDE